YPWPRLGERGVAARNLAARQAYGGCGQLEVVHTVRPDLYLAAGGRGSLTSMTTPAPSAHRQRGHRWLVSEDSAGLLPIRTGTAESATDAWTAAFETGRTALLDGQIRDLAIAVDDEIPTLGYSPSRDRHGRLDSDYVAEDLARLLQDTLRDLPRGQPRRRTTAQSRAAGPGECDRARTGT